MSVDEKRLRVVFRRAILLALASGAASAAACSTKSSSNDVTGTDAAVPPSAGDAGDAAPDGKPSDPCSAYVFKPTPPDTCGDYVKFPCGLPPEIVPRNDCFLNLTDCAGICPDLHYNCHAADGYCTDAGIDAEGGAMVVPDEAGAIVIDCATCPNGVGRPPAGLAPCGDVAARSLAGAYFARASHLEAASVVAFRRLREELARLGAPPELLQDARDAERDEVRHARTTARLARRFGGRYVRPSVAPVPERDLEAIALENAVEGCVGESFGALIATWQAENATDAAVRDAFATIAADETRHAALSWKLLAWSLSALDAEARDRVLAAADRALAALASEDEPIPSALVATAGLPTTAQRRALAATFAAEARSALAA